MGSNLPPGVSVSDLPGNDEPKERPMKGECAVCGAPVPAHLSPRKDPHTPRFCEDHDESDLADVREREHYLAQEQIQERFERI